MNKVQALIHIVTRTIGRVTKLRMKHMSLLPYQTIHHQYDHPPPPLMITQRQLADYRTVLTDVGLLLNHITLDRTTSGFRTQLHLGVTILNRSSTNLPMNKPPQKLSWKQFGSRKRTRELLKIHTTVTIILYYRNYVTVLKCHSIPEIIIMLLHHYIT